MLVLIVGCVLATAAIGGCQGAQSDDELIRETTRAFVEGFRDQDPEDICDVITDSSRRIFVDEVGKGTSSCEEALSLAFAQAPVQDFAKQPTLGAPKISGARASVIVTSPALQPGQRARIGLRKADGEWRVDMTMTGIRPPD